MGTHPNLTSSKMWQLSLAVSKAVRVFSETLPRSEEYIIGDVMVRTSVNMSADIAMAIGRDDTNASVDYRYGRGRLFTVKGLLLLANEQELGEGSSDLIEKIEELEALLNAEIDRLDALREKQDHSKVKN